MTKGGKIARTNICASLPLILLHSLLKPPTSCPPEFFHHQPEFPSREHSQAGRRLDHPSAFGSRSSRRWSLIEGSRKIARHVSPHRTWGYQFWKRTPVTGTGAGLIVRARTCAVGPRLPAVGCESGACLLQSGGLRPAHGVPPGWATACLPGRLVRTSRREITYCDSAVARCWAATCQGSPDCGLEKSGQERSR